jgi:hypothetical protein
MADLAKVTERARAATDSGLLDLRGLVTHRFEHTDLVVASTLAWWVLGGESGVREVLISDAGQAVWHRGGLIQVCGIDGLPVRLHQAAVQETAVLFDEVTQERMLAPSAPVDLVTIHNLALPEHRPPEPDEHGRRYQWIRDLIGDQQAKLTPRARSLAGSDASRCLYELVDNVHRWATASSGLAAVSITRGGGEESYDRLHIVVMDDGCGIIASFLDDAAESLPAALSDDPKGLLQHFLEKAFGARGVPRHNGHGLHVAQLLAKTWIGRIDVLSADHRLPGTVHRARSTVRRGIEGCDSFELAGARGTIVEITLNLAVADEHRAEIEALESDEQLELFPAAAW